MATTVFIGWFRGVPPVHWCTHTFLSLANGLLYFEMRTQSWALIRNQSSLISTEIESIRGVREVLSAYLVDCFRLYALLSIHTLRMRV